MPFAVHINDEGILWFQVAKETSISWQDKRQVQQFPFNGQSTEVFGSTFSKYTRLQGVQKTVHDLVFLNDTQFIALKNGGKRRPMKPGQLANPLSEHAVTTHTYWSSWGFTSPNREIASRKDRRGETVREGDVGPYKAGPDNLGNNLDPSGARRTMPTTGAGAFIGKDKARGIRTVPSGPDAMNKDHMNNQAALIARGDKPSHGLAITIPQWVHMNGYTFGAAAKPTKAKKRNYDSAGQSRTQWIAQHPGLGLYKEFFHELRVYHEAGKLDCEIVGSYRFLYRLHMKGPDAQNFKNPQICKLLMFYLHLAAHNIPPSAM